MYKREALLICSFDNDIPWSFAPLGGVDFKPYDGALDKTQFAYAEWSEDVMKVELSGEYGNTYYTVLYRLCELIENGKY